MDSATSSPDEELVVSGVFIIDWGFSGILQPWGYVDARVGAWRVDPLDPFVGDIVAARPVGVLFRSRLRRRTIKDCGEAI